MSYECMPRLGVYYPIPFTSFISVCPTFQTNSFLSVNQVIDFTDAGSFPTGRGRCECGKTSTRRVGL